MDCCLLKIGCFVRVSRVVRKEAYGFGRAEVGPVVVGCCWC